MRPPTRLTLNIALTVLVAGLVAAIVLTRAGGSDRGGKLPLAGVSPSGARFRLIGGQAAVHDDRRASWCLNLRYTGDIVAHGNAYTNGGDACGPAPAPRVSGEVLVDCAAADVYVFGGARAGTTNLRLVTADHRSIPAQERPLPPGAGFSGRAFMVTFALGDLPATLRADGAAGVILRVPRRGKVCRPVPGHGLQGVKPSLTFP